MAQVIVRNLPDDVVARLKVRARQRKHSLEQELREILREASQPSREEIIADIDRIRAAVGCDRPDLRGPGPGMGLIVDASVAVKWFIDESDSDAARLLLDHQTGLFAPDLLVALAKLPGTPWQDHAVVLGGLGLLITRPAAARWVPGAG